MTITAVGVVVPARDEEEHIAACLGSVLAALPAGIDAVVCAVLDRCVDRTAERVPPGVETLPVSESVPVGVLRDRGVRRVLRRLSAHRPEHVWLLSTDADTTVGADWVHDHLRHADDGAHAVAGLADLDDPRTLSPAARRAYARLLRDGHLVDGHTHVYGANLGIRADAYLAVDGFPAVPNGEDHALVSRLRDGGYRLVTALDARVRTSARVEGRAAGGLADLLAGL